MLETGRLRIVKFTEEDAAFMLELLNTPTWLAFIGDRGVRTLEEARQYIIDGPLNIYAQFGFGPYLVRLKESNQSIGLCGLFKRETLADVDIGFALLPDYAGNGYGYEAASAVLTYAIEEWKLPRIIGLTTATNQHSIRLLEKLGLRFEKKIRFRTDGVESLLFGLTISALHTPSL